MRDSIVVPNKRLAASPSNTSTMQHGFLVVGTTHTERSGECRMLGVWSESELDMRSGGQDSSSLTELPLMKGLVLRGLVLQDIYRSEKSVSSKWLSSSQNESTYQVKAVVTGGTLNFGTVVAREVLVTDLGNVGFCGVTFQQPGLVNIAIKANPT